MQNKHGAVINYKALLLYGLADVKLFLPFEALACHMLDNISYVLVFETVFFQNYYVSLDLSFCLGFQFYMRRRFPACTCNTAASLHAP